MTHEALGRKEIQSDGTEITSVRAGDRGSDPSGVSTEETQLIEVNTGTFSSVRHADSHVVQDGMHGGDTMQVRHGRNHQLVESDVVSQENWSSQRPEVTHSDDNEEQELTETYQQISEELALSGTPIAHIYQLATDDMARGQLLNDSNNHEGQIKVTELSSKATTGKHQSTSSGRGSTSEEGQRAQGRSPWTNAFTHLFTGTSQAGGGRDNDDDDDPTPPRSGIRDRFRDEARTKRKVRVVRRAPTRTTCLISNHRTWDGAMMTTSGKEYSLGYLMTKIT
jgi:hypothetical protein